MPKRKNKKINPRHIPVSKADVKRAKERTTASTIVLTKALVFTALLDGDFIKPEDAKPAWEKVNYLADSTKRKFITIQDMYDTLVEEYGVDLAEV